MKKCTKCKIKKDESEFYSDASRPDGIGYTCKECGRKRDKQYYQDHKLEKNAYFKKRRRKRMKTDVNYKLRCRMRTRLYHAVKGTQGLGSAIKDLGCTVEELKQYIELQFQKGMTWNNWGEWHIDHIKPLASFDLTDREQFLEACHYTNLQPLWAKDNLSKGARYGDEC